MQRLRRLKWWTLACLVVLASGCAAVPTPSPSASAPQPPTGSASLPSPAASAPSAAASAPVASRVPLSQLAPVSTDVQYVDLWARIRAGFAIPDMDGPQMQPYVQQAVHWYTTRPDYVTRMTERSRKYLYYIVEEVQRRGMPTELALLPFIESAFNPDALSSAKASGMWQFIPSTGKHYNLRQTMFVDDRRDVLASTKAALDYLSKLHDMFGDWQLALAAYNWGEGGLQRAVNNNLARGLPVSYGDLNMPAETRNYYPKLQAVKDIIEDPQRYGITLPEVPDHPYFKPVTITQDMDVTQAASLAGMTVTEFRSLNPAFKKPVILAATKPQILLPYDNATAFEQALADHQGQLASWTVYTVPKTSTPARLASELHLSEATLRQVNDIPGRTLVKAGSTLLVPRGPDDERNVSAHVVDNAVLALAPDLPQLRRLRLVAGPHDTPWTVARRYGVSAAEVARWNHVSEHGRFRPHAMVVVYARQAAPERSERVLARRKTKPSTVRVAERRRGSVHRTLRYASRRAVRHGIRVAER